MLGSVHPFTSAIFEVFTTVPKKLNEAAGVIRRKIPGLMGVVGPGFTLEYIKQGASGSRLNGKTITLINISEKSIQLIHIIHQLARSIIGGQITRKLAQQYEKQWIDALGIQFQSGQIDLWEDKKEDVKQVFLSEWSQGDDQKKREVILFAKLEGIEFKANDYLSIDLFFPNSMITEKHRQMYVYAYGLLFELYQLKKPDLFLARDEESVREWALRLYLEKQAACGCAPGSVAWAKQPVELIFKNFEDFKWKGALSSEQFIYLNQIKEKISKLLLSRKELYVYVENLLFHELAVKDPTGLVLEKLQSFFQRLPAPIKTIGSLSFFPLDDPALQFLFVRSPHFFGQRDLKELPTVPKDLSKEERIVQYLISLSNPKTAGDEVVSFLSQEILDMYPCSAPLIQCYAMYFSQQVGPLIHAIDDPTENMNIRDRMARIIVTLQLPPTVQDLIFPLLIDDATTPWHKVIDILLSEHKRWTSLWAVQEIKKQMTHVPEALNQLFEELFFDAKGDVEIFEFYQQVQRNSQIELHEKSFLLNLTRRCMDGNFGVEIFQFYSDQSVTIKEIEEVKKFLQTTYAKQTLQPGPGHLESLDRYFIKSTSLLDKALLFIYVHMSDVFDGLDPLQLIYVYPLESEARQVRTSLSSGSVDRNDLVPPEKLNSLRREISTKDLGSPRAGKGLVRAKSFVISPQVSPKEERTSSLIWTSDVVEECGVDFYHMDYPITWNAEERLLSLSMRHAREADDGLEFEIIHLLYGLFRAKGYSVVDALVEAKMRLLPFVEPVGAIVIGNRAMQLLDWINPALLAQTESRKYST